MRDTFDAYMPVLFKHEGGFTANPKDPGNWTGGKQGKGVLLGTKYGIAANSYPHEDISRMTREGAAAIYRRDYWDAIGGDGLPVGVDAVAFDIAVNMGPGRWKQWKPITKGLAPEDAIRALSERRRKFYRSLKTFETFGRGWMNRTNRVEAWAIGWAAEHATDALSDTTTKTIATSKTANSAIVVGGAGTIAVVKEGVDAAKAATEAATDAWGLAASVGPWVLLGVVIIGFAAFIWYDRRQKMIVEGV